MKEFPEMKAISFARAAVFCGMPLVSACNPMTDDPAISVCEEVLKAQLKAPKSYERVSASIDGDKALITYDAVNEFNAPLRQTKVCAYAVAPDGNLTFTSARAEETRLAVEAIQKEIDTAKAAGITEEQRQALQKRIDTTMADATSDTPAVLTDILVAMKIKGFPIDPKTTAIKAR